MRRWTLCLSRRCLGLSHVLRSNPLVLDRFLFAVNFIRPWADSTDRETSGVALLSCHPMLGMNGWVRQLGQPAIC